MIEIEFDQDGKKIKGILLGKYKTPHNEYYSVEKKFLWITKRLHRSRSLNTPLYIVFIPWKHREKELIIVDEKYVTDPHMLGRDNQWIDVSGFSSKTYDGVIYHAKVDVTEFSGYRFIYENNAFIINLHSYETWDNLSIVYENMPELLEIDLKNNE